MVQVRDIQPVANVAGGFKRRSGCGARHGEAQEGHEGRAVHDCGVGRIA